MSPPIPKTEFGQLLNQVVKNAESQANANLEAYERGEHEAIKPIVYTSRRPNWCNQCAKNPRLMPEQIPQALPGSSLCDRHQREEREMRQKLRDEAKARELKATTPNAPPASKYANTPKGSK